jgi:drug/metabolite transporter (DMT)-like permease
LNNLIKNNAVYVKLFLVALFFGGTFIAGRVMSANLSPFTSAFLRFLLASILLIFFVNKKYGGLPKLNFSQIILVTCLGITGTAGYNFFFFSGLKYIAASRASLIISLNPSVITILSILIFKDKMTKLKFAGIILSLTGALIVISNGNLLEIFQGKIGLGESFILGCVVCWCTFSVLGKIVMKQLKPIIAITYACITGTFLLLIPALLAGELPQILNYDLAIWPSLFVLSFFGTVIAFTWFYEGIDKIGPSQAGIFINFVPVFATVLAVLILNEKLYPSLLIGAVFVVTGVFLNNYRPKQDKIA